MFRTIFWNFREKLQSAIKGTEDEVLYFKVQSGISLFMYIHAYCVSLKMFLICVVRNTFQFCDTCKEWHRSLWKWFFQEALVLDAQWDLAIRAWYVCDAVLVREPWHPWWCLCLLSKLNTFRWFIIWTIIQVQFKVQEMYIAQYYCDGKVGYDIQEIKCTCHEVQFKFFMPREYMNTPCWPSLQLSHHSKQIIDGYSARFKHG